MTTSKYLKKTIRIRGGFTIAALRIASVKIVSTNLHLRRSDHSTTALDKFLAIVLNVSGLINVQCNNIFYRTQESEDKLTIKPKKSTAV